MGKPQTVRNCLRVRVSVDSLGNEDSRLVTYPNPGQVHSRVEAEDADRGRITRPEDDRRSLSFSRSIRPYCLRREQPEFSYSKLQSLHANLEREKSCGLR